MLYHPLLQSSFGLLLSRACILSPLVFVHNRDPDCNQRVACIHFQELPVSFQLRTCPTYIWNQAHSSPSSCMAHLCTSFSGSTCNIRDRTVPHHSFGQNCTIFPRRRNRNIIAPLAISHFYFAFFLNRIKSYIDYQGNKISKPRILQTLWYRKLQTHKQPTK